MLRQEDIDKLQTLIDKNQFDVAKDYLHKFEALIHNDINIYILLGDVYNRSHNLYEAERYYRKALTFNQNNVRVLTHLEQVHRIQGLHKESRELLNHIKTVEPRLSDVVDTSLSMLDLTECNLRKGFLNYEKRYAFKHMGDAYGKEWFPRWKGEESLNGSVVIIRFEQGLGDTVMFARFADIIKHTYKAKKVDVLCKTCLHNLIETIDGVDECFDVKEAKDLPHQYDYEVMMMSMPAITKISKISDIPNKPYLKVSPEDSVIWSEKMYIDKTKLNVGIVWSGELKLALGWEGQRMNSLRSTTLDTLRPILGVDGVQFYSLQKGPLQEDLKKFNGYSKIIDVMDQAVDFYDTACIMDNLDLIISVDSSPVHCAGGLGKPVWMLNRKESEHRWGVRLNGNRSAWYPSLTIYDQKEFKNWWPVVNKIASDLEKLVKKTKG